jgi:hypothetical protein
MLDKIHHAVDNFSTDKNLTYVFVATLCFSLIMFILTVTGALGIEWYYCYCFMGLIFLVGCG